MTDVPDDSTGARIQANGEGSIWRHKGQANILHRSGTLRKQSNLFALAEHRLVTLLLHQLLAKSDILPYYFHQLLAKSDILPYYFHQLLAKSDRQVRTQTLY